MKRNLLLHLLQNYIPKEHEEEDTKKKILTFVKEHPDCFERSLAIGHITASAWVLDYTGTKALLMHHAKLNLWVQCGGHCDGNPDTLSVAIREAQEESGLTSLIAKSKEIFDIDIHLIPSNTKEKAHLHYDIRYLLQNTKDEPLTKNHESKALIWIEQDSKNFPPLEKSVSRMQKKWHKFLQN